jgi:hypothetical protein
MRIDIGRLFVSEFPIDQIPGLSGPTLRSATAINTITSRMEAIIKEIEMDYGRVVSKRDRDKMTRALSEIVGLTDLVV